MSKLAILPIHQDLLPDELPRPPNKPPRSPIIKIPDMEKVPEQQPPDMDPEPEIVPFPPGMPQELPRVPPPEERAED